MKKLTLGAMLIKKGVSLLLTIAACFSVMNIAASDAVWRTGRVSDYGDSAYTTVRLNHTDKEAQIKVHAYSYLINQNNAKEQSAVFHVTLYTTGGSLVWEGEIITGIGGEIVTLPRTYSAYRICIRQSDAPLGSWAPEKANYWGIQCVSNCYI